MAFSSAASNLTAGDSGGFRDVFLRNVDTGSILNLSQGGNGNSGSALFPCKNLAVSGDANVVAFVSNSTNLAGDTTSAADIFVFDTQTGLLIGSRSSQATQFELGSRCPDLSANGSLLSLISDAPLVPNDANGIADVYLRDTNPDSVTAIVRISLDTAGGDPNGPSHSAALDGSGRFVVFSSDASDLVPGDTNGQRDIFLADTQTGTIERINLGPGGAQTEAVSDSPAISADGSIIAFWSSSDLLTGDNRAGAADIFLFDRDTGSLLSGPPVVLDGSPLTPLPLPISLGRDARRVSFTASSASGSQHIALWDRFNGTTRLIGGDQGGAGSAQLADDSALIAFDTSANGLAAGEAGGQFDVFRASAASTTPLAPGFQINFPPQVAVNGRSVTVFMESFSIPSNLLRRRKAVLAAAASRRPVPRSKPQLNFQVSVRNQAGNVIRRRNSKKNVLTIKALPPGNFNVSYSVQVKRDKKVLARSSESPPSPITITR